MRTLPLTASVILLIPLTVLAQGKASDWPDTSGAHRAILAADEVKKADDALRRQFAAFLRDVRTLHKANVFFSEDIDGFLKSLQQSQRAWLAYRRSLCAAEGMATQSGSSWQNVQEHKCSLRLIADRKAYLNKLADSVKNGFDSEAFESTSNR